MLHVLVNGCNGKMGHELINQLQFSSDFVLCGGFDERDKGLNSFPVYTHIEQITKKPNVIIDFSIPIATLTILEYALLWKIPIVIATTGFTKEQMNKIQKASLQIPIFQSANMSFDIALMKKIVAQLATLLPENDIEIIETHHNQKIDAPSGTALLLADSINTALGNTMQYVFNRHHANEKRTKKEIGFSSIRGGNIVGEHTVQFLGEYETFEIKHTTYSRKVYAEGALKAARFIVSQSPRII